MDESEYVVVVPHRFMERTFDKVIVFGSIIVLLVTIALAVLSSSPSSKASPVPPMTQAQQTHEWTAWTVDQWDANPGSQRVWCEAWQLDPESAGHTMDHLTDDPAGQAQIQLIFRYLLNTDCLSILNP